MNLLVEGFTDGKGAEVINGIISGLSINNFVLISNVDTSRISIKADLYIDGMSIYLENIEENLDWNEIRPIDAVLIEKMLRCEHLYYKLIDRVSYFYGKKFSYEEKQKRYYMQLRYMNHILEEYQIDLCISDAVPHCTYNYILFELCRIKNIKFLCEYPVAIIPKLFSQKYIVEDIYDPLPKLDEDYQKLTQTLGTTPTNDLSLKRQYADFICYYSAKENPTISLNKATKVWQCTSWEFFVRRVQYTCKEIIEGKSWGKYRIPQYIKKKIRQQFVSKHYSKLVREIPPNSHFIYYPLHYQPECTSLPLGKYYNDQLLVVEVLSSVLPEDMILVVKAHPNLSVDATKAFYSRIDSYKNVLICSKDISTYELIDRCIAVATLTGTVGWEALLRDKPVLMFGYFCYQYAPGVFQINSIKDCKDAVKRIMNKQYELNRRSLTIFLKALQERTFDGVIYPNMYELGAGDRSRYVENEIEAFLTMINQ